MGAYPTWLAMINIKRAFGTSNGLHCKGHEKFDMAKSEWREALDHL